MESTGKEPSLKSSFLPLAWLTAVALGEASPIGAQARPEVRADAIVARQTAVYGGVGILFPMGTYVRSGIIGGAGAVNGGATIRLDIVSLFHADPFRESRWGPYGGGGISIRHDTGAAGTNSYLLAFLGIEGPFRDGFAPAFELGLGGGVRAGAIIRWASARTR